MRRQAVGLLLLAALVPAPVQAQPAGPGSALEVEGATYAEFDECSGLFILRGAPVVVRRGAMVLRAPSITYDTGGRVIRAAGGVRYREPNLAVDAPEVTAWIAEERLRADGGISAVHGEGEQAVTLRAAHLEVFARERRAVASGSAEAVSQDVTLTGDRIEVALARDEVVADGQARVVRGDIEGRAPRVLVRRGEGTAVLSGGAIVRQGANEARAQTITVELRRRRVRAHGQAVLILQPPR